MYIAYVYTRYLNEQKEEAFNIGFFHVWFSKMGEPRLS